MTASAPRRRQQEAAAQFLRALTAVQLGLELLADLPATSLDADRERLMALLNAAVEGACLLLTSAFDPTDPAQG
jgi:hypothetical protein